jgi:hypothetical protein
VVAVVPIPVVPAVLPWPACPISAAAVEAPAPIALAAIDSGVVESPLPVGVAELVVAVVFTIAATTEVGVWAAVAPA